jgi:hypothetical protein
MQSNQVQQSPQIPFVLLQAILIDPIAAGFLAWPPPVLQQSTEEFVGETEAANASFAFSDQV